MAVLDGIVSQQVGSSVFAGRTAAYLPSVGYPLESAARSALGKTVGVVGLGLLVTDLIGRAGGYQWRDDLLAKINGGKGARVNGTVAGAGSGVLYDIEIQFRPGFSPSDITSSFTLEGAIGGLSTVGNDYVISIKNGTEFYPVVPGVYQQNYVPRILSIKRHDGQEETGTKTPTVEGYLPSGYISPPSGAPIPPPSNTPTKTAPNNPTKTPDKPKRFIDPDLFAPTAPPPESPPSRNPSKAPTGIPQKTPTDPKQDDPKKSPTPNKQTPDEENRDNILKIFAGLTVLGASIAYIKGLNDQINEQTKPSAQKANVCETLNTPSCTQGFEGRIKDPINQNVNEKTGALNTALSAVNTGLSTFITAATSNFEKILGVLDNQFVDRAMGVVNTALNIHNALMLSADLGRTAAGLVDAAIQFTPLRFVASNGSATTASRVFGQNIEAFFINIIGVENYTNLSTTWAVSNRVIRSSTNLLNRVENVMNKTGKVNQQTGIQVGNLANAMLVNGLISKNSYPKVAATKAANDPIDSETADELTSTVGSVGSSIKNLTNVTKEVLTVTRNVQKITTEFGKLAQLANADSTVRKNLYTQISTKAKRRSIYTILDVKQIKINANGRPNSNPFR